MIDLNCHILPGLDDGPDTMEKSLEMAKAAVDQGIETVVAAPRFQPSIYENNRERILSHCRELNDELFQQGIDLKILPGHEVKIHGELVDDIKSGTIIPVNETSNYVFIVFSNKEIPHYAKQVLYDMHISGYLPVIVHPEQNQILKKEPDLLYQLVKNGAITQISAASLMNKHGRSTQKFALQLIEHNLAHVIASNAYDHRKKGFFLPQAYEKVKKVYGSEVMYQFMENAHVILNNEMVYADPPERIKSKKKLGIFPSS
ncbi:tyrosine-protein phosphatase [Halobacillus litoralis]|uniref:tyrosine-protein phosphatase n=1 Tax=Halobacillus litoralis TaxID=45668 RepID=UPI001CFD6BBE|nr:CpsB/CapC family capsule biosynthesis tyrosine phosphatase [Halobacillus litoralis]